MIINQVELDEAVRAVAKTLPVCSVRNLAYATSVSYTHLDVYKRQGEKMIHLTIDGIPVEVEKGTTILQAARQIGAVSYTHLGQNTGMTAQVQQDNRININTADEAQLTTLTGIGATRCV